MHAQDPVPRLPPEKKHWQPLDRAMAKSPDNRHRNAQQMLGALNQIASGAGGSQAGPRGKFGAFFKARWKPMVSGLAGVALVVVTLVWLQRERPDDAPTDFFTVQDSGSRGRRAAGSSAGGKPRPRTGTRRFRHAGRHGQVLQWC